MLSLEERHKDRARRIVANASEVRALPGVSVGAAALALRNFFEIRRRLNDDDRKTLDDRVSDIEKDVEDTISLAEAPDGTGRTMAGIGVVNTKVVPAGIETPEAGNGGGTDVEKVDGWGANESPSNLVPTSDTNLGGQALQEQGAGSDLKASGKGAETPTEQPAPPAPKSDAKK